jgi:hypothetical protein
MGLQFLLLVDPLLCGLKSAQPLAALLAAGLEVFDPFHGT